MNMQTSEQNESSIRASSDPSRIRPRISIITPIYNEAEHIDLLVESLNTALGAIGYVEGVCVDDVSTHGSFGKLTARVARQSWFRVIRYRPKDGQTDPKQV